ncbi:hypothetical protein Zmor_024796 [Zophobas morio]|uniref:Uncharacterized protein n=1 Tax=Zophobas morio TaxID=2755281 RepID=A0AA38M904_9CUCU|nr:hypothetical protein Zmor_024796 [Zophobas morio]
MNETYFKARDVFTPVLIDQGICYSYNMLDRSHIFRDNVVHHSNFYNVRQKSHDYDFDAGWGYSKEAEMETYPRRALMSGADNSFDIYLKYNSNDTDYICNAFHQGYRV